MTEDEAKEKLCPMLSVGLTWVKCKASGCALWDSWEFGTKDRQTGKPITRSKGMGECGLKSQPLQCNGGS